MAPDPLGAASTAVAAAFGAVARLRQARGLHPRGAVVDATLHVTGTATPTGSEWVDRPPDQRVVVQLSRRAGLPPPLPDLLGLAIRSTGPDGDTADLLLSGSGRRRVLRHLIAPAVHPLRAGYSSLVRFRTDTGPLLVGAFPADGGLELAVARTRGAWERFALLELDARPEDRQDADLHFDPDRPPPGLRMPAALARFREPSYVASRRAYHAGGGGDGDRMPALRRRRG